MDEKGLEANAITSKSNFCEKIGKMASEPEAEAVDWQSIKSLVFGGGVKQTVLDRWLQPFTFSPQVEEKSCLSLKSHPKEPAALVQGAGGPCAVLAPLQAFLLKVAQLFHERCKLALTSLFNFDC